MTTHPTQGNALALVTGSAHRLGRLIALHLASMGYDIALHYNHSQSQALATAAEIRGKGVKVHQFQADISQPAEIDRLFSVVNQVQTPLKLLVNSAAIMPHVNLLEMSVPDWDEVFNLNLRAAWLCSKQAASLMKNSAGSIINITDSGAGGMWTNYAAYSMSKSALETLTRLLARTLAPSIRVNGIAPGLFLPAPDMPETDWQRLVKRLPLPQAAKPEHLNQALDYLIQNTHVTGQILVVDGGYQLL